MFGVANGYIKLVMSVVNLSLKTLQLIIIIYIPPSTFIPIGGLDINCNTDLPQVKL